MQGWTKVSDHLWFVLVNGAGHMVPSDRPEASLSMMGNISMFNFRNYDGMDESFAKFLNDNKQTLGVDPALEYLPGNDLIYTAFGDDVSRSYAADVSLIIGRYKVLIYNGQNDVVVNTPGVLHYLSSIDWVHIDEWKRTKKQIFTLGQ